MASTSDLSRWTYEEEKLFEDCIVDYVGRWEEIAALLRTKSAAEVEHHYALLLRDLAAIEAGEIEPPAYLECSKSVKRKTSKARPCTEDEHRFLQGLEKYGKRGLEEHIENRDEKSGTSSKSCPEALLVPGGESNQKKKRRNNFDYSI